MLIYNKTYVSSIAYLDKREILNKVLDVTNEETTLLDMLELSGRQEVTEQPVYRNFVNTELYETVTVGAAGGATAGGAGQAITVNVVGIPANVHANAGSLVHIPATRQVGYVYSKAAGAGSTTDLVLRPVKNTDILIVANDAVLSVFSNANGEGSGSPEARRWGMNSQWNMVQNFKQKGGITNLQKATTIEVDYNGKPYIMFKAQHDTLKRHRSDIAYDMIMGQRGTLDASGLPHLVDAEGNLVYTTGGLDETIGTGGISVDIGSGSGSGITGYDLAMFKSITRLMNKERCPDSYYYLLATEQQFIIDDIFKNIPGASTGIRYDNAFGSNGEKKAIDLSVDGFKIYGREYFKKMLPELDHKKITAVTGHDWTYRGYLVPTDQVKVDHGSNTVNRIRSRYISGDGYDGRYHEAMLGKLAGVPTSDKSVLEWHYESWMGGQYLGIEHFVKLHV